LRNASKDVGARDKPGMTVSSNSVSRDSNP
jgi:hypothetical protein